MKPIYTVCPFCRSYFCDGEEIREDEEVEFSDHEPVWGFGDWHWQKRTTTSLVREIAEKEICNYCKNQEK
jgi:hypothetical protein